MKAELYLGVTGIDTIIGIQRTINIPFPPMAGMELAGIKCGNNHCWPIESVCWDIDKEIFEVHLENDIEHCGQTARQNIEEEWGPGWTEA